MYASREPIPRPSKVSMGGNQYVELGRRDHSIHTMKNKDNKQDFEFFINGKCESDQDTVVKM